KGCEKCGLTPDDDGADHAEEKRQRSQRPPVERRDWRRRRGGEDHIVATAAVVRDHVIETARPAGDRRAVGEAGEGPDYRIAAVVVDDRERVPRRNAGAASRKYERRAVEVHRAVDVQNTERGRTVDGLVVR